MSREKPRLYAVIAVAHRDDRTFYVKRSTRMANYPGVWSLLSTQFDPRDLPDVRDLGRVQRYLDVISKERLGGTAIRINRFLTSGDSDDNPIDRHVFLRLYEVELDEEPHLNARYYTDAAWMTAEQYELASAGQGCGLCLRLWSDYAWLAGITDRPFVPRGRIDAA